MTYCQRSATVRIITKIFFVIVAICLCVTLAVIFFGVFARLVLVPAALVLRGLSFLGLPLSIAQGLAYVVVICGLLLAAFVTIWIIRRAWVGMTGRSELNTG